MKQLETKCYDFSCRVYPSFSNGYSIASNLYQKINTIGTLSEHIYEGNGTSSSYVKILFSNSIILNLDIPLDNGGYRIDINRDECSVHYFNKTETEKVFDFINNINHHIIDIDKDIEEKIKKRNEPIIFSSSLVKDAIKLAKKKNLSIDCDFKRYKGEEYLKKLEDFILPNLSTEVCLQNIIKEASNIMENDFNELERRFIILAFKYFHEEIKFQAVNNPTAKEQEGLKILN